MESTKIIQSIVEDQMWHKARSSKELSAIDTLKIDLSNVRKISDIQMLIKISPNKYYLQNEYAKQAKQSVPKSEIWRVLKLFV